MPLFCKKCGSLLYPTKENKMICRNCGTEYDSLENKLVIVQKIQVRDKTYIVEEDDTGTVEWRCPKCGYNRAYLITFPPLRGDEDETILYRCAKCGYSCRESTKIL